MQGSDDLDFRSWQEVSPTMGDLLALCEENYYFLHCLAPQLRRLHGRFLSIRPGDQDLHLIILEQTRYTTLLRLTYSFPHPEGEIRDPDILLRVYHDACQVEVEDLQQQILPTARIYEAPALMNKWRLNVFVAKWLAFCLCRGHLFVADLRCAALSQT